MQRYEAYRDSGVEWIGEIPEGWEVVNLSALATQRKRKNIGSIEGNVLSLSYGRIKRRIIDNSGLLPESFETYNVIEPGDIVLRLTDLQNDQVSLRVGRSDERGIITSAYCTLNPNNVDSRYLFDILACFDYQKGFYGLAGGVRQGLTFDGIKGLKFPLPSIREQQAIADYLDEKTAEIDSIVSQTERSIELLREYRKSVISEAVTKGLDPDAPMRDSSVEWIGEIPEGWEAKKSKSEMTFINGRAYKQEELLNEGPYRVLRVGNFNTNDSWYYTDLELPEKQYCSKGDLLYLWATTFGPEIWTGEKVVFHYHIWKVETTNSLIKKYAFYALLASSVWQELQSHGSTMVHITKNGMENTFYPFPPLPEQRAIADYLDAKTAEIDSLIADKQRQVELLKEYRKSLISEAVTGKFKVPGLE